MLSNTESTFYYKKESPYLIVNIAPTDEELREQQRIERQRTSLQLRKLKESKNRVKKPLLKEHQEKG